VKIRKTMTQKAIVVNQRNARKSTGPRTTLGKKNCSRNAIRSGLFCHDLYIEDADREQYEELKACIEEQLRPTTPLRQLAVAGIIAAAWRCRLALRQESRYVARKLSLQPESCPEPEKITITEWYGTNPRATANAIKLINMLIPEVRRDGSCSGRRCKEGIRR